MSHNILARIIISLVYRYLIMSSYKPLWSGTYYNQTSRLPRLPKSHPKSHYAFALFLRILDFNGLAIRDNFQGFQGVKKFLQKCSQNLIETFKTSFPAILSTR